MKLIHGAGLLIIGGLLLYTITQAVTTLVEPSSSKPQTQEQVMDALKQAQQALQAVTNTLQQVTGISSPTPSTSAPTSMIAPATTGMPQGPSNMPAPTLHAVEPGSSSSAIPPMPTPPASPNIPQLQST